MSLVSDNIATITAQAATLDTLIADFRAAAALISAAEPRLGKHSLPLTTKCIADVLLSPNMHIL
jgi:hypothetical protein